MAVESHGGKKERVEQELEVSVHLYGLVEEYFIQHRTTLSHAQKARRAARSPHCLPKFVTALFVVDNLNLNEPKQKNGII